MVSEAISYLGSPHTAIPNDLSHSQRSIPQNSPTYPMTSRERKHSASILSTMSGKLSVLIQTTHPSLSIHLLSPQTRSKFQSSSTSSRSVKLSSKTAQKVFSHYASCRLAWTNLSSDQRRRVLDTIQWFVATQKQEQQAYLLGQLPSLEEYMERRMGTSAVAVCLAAHEYDAM